MFLIWGMWFAIGAIVGSFLNVCIYRLPREESIVQPPSHCPRCRYRIAWYDNIPIISYLFLRERCRRCRAAIHWRYPVVELSSGLSAIAVFQRFGLTPLGFVYVAFVWSLIVVTFIDLEHQIIPDEISLGGLAVGLVLSMLVPALHATAQPLVALGRSALGALVGGGVLYVTGLLGTFLFKKEAMGGGDVKLLAMAGSLLGWQLVVLTFFVAPLLALIPGVLVLWLKRSHMIPYGPFLSLALVLALFVGHRVIALSGMEDAVHILWIYYGWGPR